MGEQTQGTLGSRCRGACVERIEVTRDVKECLHIAGIKGGGFLQDMPAGQDPMSYVYAALTQGWQLVMTTAWYH